jgi:mannose-6-phosphate isomerase-like protein (cupin superfamily)
MRRPHFLFAKIVTIDFKSGNCKNYSMNCDSIDNTDKPLEALYISKDSIMKDESLKEGNRGARKLLVTELYASKEIQATDVTWNPPISQQKCPVHVTSNLELAYFTEIVPQDKHYHKIATEIYNLMEGWMIIELDGIEIEMKAGDTIVVNPNTIHLIKKSPKSDHFLCQVVAANSAGISDKYVLE